MKCATCRANVEDIYICARCALGRRPDPERESRGVPAGLVARAAQARLVQTGAQEDLVHLQSLQGKKIHETQRTFNAQVLMQRLRAISEPAGYARVGPYIIDDNRSRRKRNRIAFVVWRRKWLKMWAEIGLAHIKA